jgi:galactokinase
MRDHDVRELKDVLKDVQKTLHGVDKTVAIHSKEFESIKTIKETVVTNRESTKSAHHRIDEVERDMRKGFEEIQAQQKEQFDDFKKLVEDSNKSHDKNFEKMRAFGWKVFFLFAAPFAAGIVSFFWFVFNKGAGIK